MIDFGALWIYTLQHIICMSSWNWINQILLFQSWIKDYFNHELRTLEKFDYEKLWHQAYLTKIIDIKICMQHIYISIFGNQVLLLPYNCNFRAYCSFNFSYNVLLCPFFTSKVNPELVLYWIISCIFKSRKTQWFLGRFFKGRAYRFR